jgi:hypothetical protein
MKKYLWPILFLLMGATQAPQLTVKTDHSLATIGEKIRVSITGTIPQSTTPEGPAAFEGLKGLILSDHGLKQGFSLFGHKRFTAWYIFKGFEPGEYEIPEIAFTFRSKTGGDQTAATRKIKITIKNLVQGDPEKLEIKDIKGAIRRLSLKMVLGLCALIVSLAAWLITAVMRKKAVTPQEAPPIPAHIIALQKIKELEQKELISRGLVSEYYYELSMIIRQYCEGRFLLRAPEMTTEEFLSSLRESQALSSNHKQLLKNFLSQCDLVKFAQYGPGNEENHAALDAAKKFIEETIPA